MKYYTQYDSMDCGPTCIRIIAAMYGKEYSLQYLREKCQINRNGVSLSGINMAAQEIGFDTKGVKVTWTQLKELANIPCIVHWNQNHFVVVKKIVRKKGQYKVWVIDPALGKLLKYNESDFLQSWLVDTALTTNHNKGIVLLLRPNSTFLKHNNEDKKIWSFGAILNNIYSYKKFFVFLGVSVLLASFLGLVLPFLTQYIVDIGIGSGDISFIVAILIAQLFITLGQAVNNLIRNWLMLHMTTRVSISLVSRFLSKIMRLPIAFFDSRRESDILQRIDDHNRIQSFLTGSVISIIIAFFTFLIYGYVIIGYSFKIFGVFLIGSVIYVSWILLFMKYRKALDYMRFQGLSENQDGVIQMVKGMQDIKLNNCEQHKLSKWEILQVKLFKVDTESLTINQIQSIGGTFIDQIKNITISFLAASFVIEGNLTLGMMMALQYVIGQLNAPLSQFIEFIQVSQDAKISFERMNEIHQICDEEPKDSVFIQKIPDDAEIEFRNVVFKYDGPQASKVLDDLCFKIPANKITAIVGDSGSGKTTILKMILGFYKPTSGDILVNNIELFNYSPSLWRSHCGVVMQEGFIFSDTILNNISLSDDNPDIERVKKAVEIANIGDLIDSLPLGYETVIGTEGTGLSTGQKQRILIARAAYKNSKYLLFDEATNALDVNNEKAIMNKLRQLFEGKTVIVVAHRLSTIRNADNIIVLSQGKIVEQGTHSELFDQRGYYYKLVEMQACQ